jgi:hypothetical protein
LNDSSVFQALTNGETGKLGAFYKQLCVAAAAAMLKCGAFPTVTLTSLLGFLESYRGKQQKKLIPENYLVIQIFVAVMDNFVSILGSTNELYSLNSNQLPTLYSVLVDVNSANQNYSEEISKIKENYTKITACLTAKYSRVAEKQFTRAEAQVFKEKAAMLSEFGKFFGVSVPAFQQCLQDFDTAKSDYEKLYGLRGWLRRLKFDVSSPDYRSVLVNELGTLKHLEMSYDDLKKSLYLETDIANLIIYFLEQKSMLFEALAQKFVSAWKEPSLKDVPKLVNEIKAFMKKIITPEVMLLSEFDVFKKLTDNDIFASNTLQHELETMYIVFFF